MYISLTCPDCGSKSITIVELDNTRLGREVLLFDVGSYDNKAKCNDCGMIDYVKNLKSELL